MILLVKFMGGLINCLAGLFLLPHILDLDLCLDPAGVLSVKVIHQNFLSSFSLVVSVF